MNIWLIILGGIITIAIFLWILYGAVQEINKNNGFRGSGKESKLENRK
jgi:hypothetical protein